MSEQAVKQYHCSVSGEVIPQARVEFLLESGIPEDRWTTVKHSNVQKKKGIFVGEVLSEEGVEEAGELVIVDRVDNSSVMLIMPGAEAEEE